MANLEPRHPHSLTAGASIVGTATVLPPHAVSQTDMKRALRDTFNLDDRRAEALSSLLDSSLVDRRYSVLPAAQLGRPRGIEEQMRIYREHALPLARNAAERCLHSAGITADQVDFLVTVSCTGFLIPSLDVFLLDELPFRRDVRRVPLTELGCVGGAAALARAFDLVRDRPGTRALVIAVELPSLCLQPGDQSAANMVSSALFGDGAAAALVVGGEAGGTQILTTRSHVAAHSSQALGFDLRDDGFHIVLARELPELVGASLPSVITALLADAGVDRGALRSFLFHPGGRKVLEAVERALELAPEDTAVSWDVLRRYGNQSSASVLFVLDHCLSRGRPEAGSHGLLGAFGPGLSTELLLLRWN